MLVSGVSNGNVLIKLITEARAWLDRIALERQVECKPPRTTARLLDKVDVDFFFLSSKIVLTSALYNLSYPM